MSKYIIEIKPEYEDKFKGVMILGAENSNLYVDSNTVDELEELTADYINEHFSDLQDTAYQKGINDGSLDVKQRVEGAYQKGLDEAWKAAKRISVIELNGGLAGKELMKIYGTMDIHKIYDDNTASEAIEKLKAYEEKKSDDEIKVGDEVEWDGDKYIVTYPNKDINTGIIQDYDVMGVDGSVVDHVSKCAITKTGRHFDIQSILEEMRHD